MARILVVDDEPRLRAILERLLSSEGYEVRTAGDGFAAIAEMRREPPDLVLLDVVMPVLDGTQVVRWMRRNYRTASVPVIFLTAGSGQKERLQGLLEGANDYLTKPYEPAELVLRIRNLVELSRRRRDANPLTGLPGPGAILDEAAEKIARKEPYAYLGIDLDRFKSYNDYYGYKRGDAVIAHTARLVCGTLDQVCSGEGFAGHLGGDDFIVLTGLDRGLEFAHELVAAFDAAAPGFYDEADRLRRYIEVADRAGKVERFPILTMTIAAALDEGGSFPHVGALGAVIAELKRHGKMQAGSVVLPDRRGSAPHAQRQTTLPG